MYPNILHIYGPLYVNSYGTAIFIALIVFIVLATKDSRLKKVTSPEKFINIVIYGTLVGIIGGRLLDIFNNLNNYSFYECIAIWEPGYSLLGSVISITLFLVWYLKKEKIQTLKFLDIVGTYAPLLQSISRVGCFFAGCCYGRETAVPWAIIYTHPDVASALKFVPIHPSQLYSSAILFLIFILMKNLTSKIKTPGILFFVYLMLLSVERFTVDFFRADQEFYSSKLLSILSIHQWISVLIFNTALLSALYLKNRHR